MAGETREIDEKYQIVIEQALLNLFLTSSPDQIANAMVNVLEQGRRINRRYERWQRAQADA